MRVLVILAVVALLGCGSSEDDKEAVHGGGAGGVAGEGGTGGADAPTQAELEAACVADCAWRYDLCPSADWPWEDRAECERGCAFNNDTRCELDRLDRCETCRNQHPECPPSFGADPCQQDCYVLRCQAFDDCDGSDYSEIYGFTCEQRSTD